jgi:hypothetical protein
MLPNPTSWEASICLKKETVNAIDKKSKLSYNILLYQIKSIYIFEKRKYCCDDNLSGFIKHKKFKHRGLYTCSPII